MSITTDSPGPPAEPEVVARFPSGFLWGTATAAHQVEGNNVNSDWWAWEQAGHCKDSQRSGDACDHYRRFRDDFALMKDLHQNAHRLSVEWARIEPRSGEFDRDALQHYRTVLETLRDRGIEPVVTLHHFTNPQWLSAGGGWENGEVVPLFERYVAKVVDTLGDLARYWVTINEPNVLTSYGYLYGTWPPGRGSPASLYRAVGNLVRAHGRAYQAIHARLPDARVGVTHNWRIFVPHRPRPADWCVAMLRHALFTRYFSRALVDGVLRFPFGYGQRIPEARNSQDFFGLNYYTREIDAFAWNRPSNFFAREVLTDGPRDDGGGEIYPRGFELAIRDVARLGIPILVTENGVPDRDDRLRPGYLVGHLLAMHRAMRAGAPVSGYLHWSLMDNYEWLDGRNLRFGLVEVDYKSQRRTVRPSGRLYAEICRTSVVTTDQVQAATWPANPRYLA